MLQLPEFNPPALPAARTEATPTLQGDDGSTDATPSSEGTVVGNVETSPVCRNMESAQATLNVGLSDALRTAFIGNSVNVTGNSSSREGEAIVNEETTDEEEFPCVPSTPVSYFGALHLCKY